MKDLEKLTDEQLVGLYKSKTVKAFDQLYLRYKDNISATAHKYKTQGVDFDDLVQEGAWGLFNAIMKYDSERQGASSFKTYANVCINSCIITAVKAAKANKNKPLNESDSLDDGTESVEGEHQQSPEDEIIEKESKKEFLVNINAKLSAFEKQVFVLMIKGYKYQEISQKLNVSAKSVDNAMQRIKGKVKKL